MPTDAPGSANALGARWGGADAASLHRPPRCLRPLHPEELPVHRASGELCAPGARHQAGRETLLRRSHCGVTMIDGLLDLLCVVVIELVAVYLFVLLRGLTG